MLVLRVRARSGLWVGYWLGLRSALMKCFAFERSAWWRVVASIVMLFVLGLIIWAVV